MFKKAELLEQMRPQMSKIVSAWNKYGIIIESQFDFADHLNLKRHYVEIYQILVEFGGERVEMLENDEDIHAFVSGKYIAEEGLMYCIFNPDKLTIDDIWAIMTRYFESKRR